MSPELTYLPTSVGPDDTREVVMFLLSNLLLPILVAATAAFILGAIWHGPLFGKQWLRMMEIPDEKVAEMKAKGMGAMAPQMVTAFIQQVVIAFITFFFLGFARSHILLAVYLMFVVWLGYTAMPLLNGVLWEGRKIRLYLFNIVYQLVSLQLIALILMLMR